jgi:hypothetical protein
MNFITDNLQALTVLFAAFVVLAVLVTGFFVGRAWLRKIDATTGWNSPAGRAEKAANAAAPADQKWL